jgi:hypothetical protein
MTVDPDFGGRILGFSLNGQEVLLPESAVAGTDNANNYGVTFWPSPQSMWQWPPIEGIDGDPYRAGLAGNALLLTSGEVTMPDSELIVVTKRFEAVAGKDAIDVTYQFHNRGARAITLAPWQIARVRAYGLSFFRLGAGGVAYDKLATVTRDGIQWYGYDPSHVTGQGFKLFADGRGWIAHVDEELLFVQTFPDLAPGQASSGEAEVEIYADPSHTYVELEPQGIPSLIEPGQSSPPWTVRFHLARLPSSLVPMVGSQELVSFVENLIER